MNVIQSKILILTTSLSLSLLVYIELKDMFKNHTFQYQVHSCYASHRLLFLKNRILLLKSTSWILNYWVERIGDI